MQHSRRNAGQAGIGAAPVTADGDDVNGFVLHLALAHQRFISGGDAQGACAGGEQLGVHPWNGPWSGVITGVGYVHAPGAVQHDCSGTSGFCH